MDPLIPIAAKTASPFLGAFKNIFKGAKDEFIDWFQIGITEYIEDRKTKFTATNTFISRTEKVNFYDIYFPLNLRSSSKQITSDNLLAEIFKKNNCAAILGIAGSGKTMLMKHAFLQCYNQLYAIPIFIELRDLNTLGISLLDYIYLIVLKNKIKPSTKIVERALENGGFVFFFDGFDEISIGLKEKLVLEIEHLVDYYNKNKFLISSRPGANVETLPRFHSFVVAPLTHEQIIQFIKTQLFNIDDCELVEKLTGSINLNNKDYVEYLTNPLLLSMYILTYRSYPELPKSKNKFYWNVFDTLCTKHDSINKKGAYTHEKKCKLQNENFEVILRWFCYISVLEDRFNFDEQYLTEKLQYIKKALNFECDIKDLIYDLTVSISILIVDGLDYKFPHRTMQDYFMILFIREQTDDAKELIYKEKFVRIYPIPSNKNIFDLCLELDKDAYYKYYILPLFDKFTNSYNNISVIENAISYLTDINLQLTISVQGEKFEMSVTSRLLISHIDIASFYGIKNHDIFSIREHGNINDHPIVETFLSEANNDSEGTTREGKKFRSFRFKELPHEILKAFVIEYFDLKQFEIYLEKMRNQYILLQEEFKRDQQTKNALIDFAKPRLV